MSKRVKTEEVRVEEGKLASDEVTDLEIFVKDKKIGSIFQETADGQIQLTYMNDRKGSAVSIDEGLHSIIADYNLHN
ncbi:MAG: DUF2969 domain-containing protein [Atopostipes sp.]|nr:DUF2969 domain-containing protein [Atopostipes sp.]